MFVSEIVGFIQSGPILTRTTAGSGPLSVLCACAPGANSPTSAAQHTAAYVREVRRVPCKGCGALRAGSADARQRDGLAVCTVAAAPATPAAAATVVTMAAVLAAAAPPPAAPAAPAPAAPATAAADALTPTPVTVAPAATPTDALVATT